MSPRSTVHSPESVEPSLLRWSLGCGLWSVVCGLCFVSTGCVRQSLTIRTDPPGAMVYINDQLKGTSPVTYNFMWYGWHRVTLRKEGFQRLDDRKQLHAPIYLWIPLDLMMELLPFPIRDTREWSYTLTPSPAPPMPQPPTELVPPTGERGSPGAEGGGTAGSSGAAQQPAAETSEPPTTESTDEPR